MFLAALLLLGGCGFISNNSAEEPKGAEDIINVTEFMEDAFAPSPIRAAYAEEKPYRQLADFLTDYYDIPEEDLADTAYYYQYYDFDGDGTDELLAVLVSEEMRESAGDPALLLEENKNEHTFTMIESFERVHTPIIVGDNITNGWHDIIFNQYGRGVESGYLYCSYEEGSGYWNDSNELLDEVPEEFTGTALLSDNMIDDKDKGTYLTLAH